MRKFLLINLIFLSSLFGHSRSDTPRQSNHFRPLVLNEEIAPVSTGDGVLSDLSYLNKLSQSLRGIAPEQSEYMALNEAIKNGDGDHFLEKKLSEFIADKAFSEMLAWRLEELFRLVPGTSRIIDENTDRSTYFNMARTFDPLSNLFRDIGKENRSWDELLTGKSYRLPIFEGVSPYKEFYNYATEKPEPLDFGSALFSFLLKYPTAFEAISFHSNDQRIAGALTTPRFFDRYVTTGLNKNRRRAAAVFRIFLCDSMIPAIPEKHDTNRLADLFYPETNGENKLSSSDDQMPTEAQVRAVAERKHGEQADCMSCHYKLDPLGKNFRASSGMIGPTASSGGLIYKTKLGEIVNIPTRGVGDLGAAIVKQREYRDCQIRHFWNWYIGEDVQVTATRIQELGELFDAQGRRPQDFVKYLVKLPEFRFRNRPTELQSLVSGVRKLFSKCASCHIGKTSEMLGPIPDLTSWPIGIKHEIYPDPKFWLGRISINLGLENGGRGRRMPPLDEGFRISVDELMMVKKWIQLGAPDESGNKMIAPSLAPASTRTDGWR